MKVLCIDASECHRLKENKIYTAFQGSEYFKPSNYLIAELNDYYCQDRFIPLSDVDETKFIREYDLSKETKR